MRSSKERETEMSIITTIDSLQQTWALLFPGSPVPDKRQCALWLTMHPEKTVRAAIAKLAIKQNSGATPITNLDRFATSIMQRIDHEGKVPAKTMAAQVPELEDANGNR